MTTRKAKDLILSNIEQLDIEMTEHQESCEKCPEEGPCEAWVDMVETWNFYHVAMVRALKNKYLELNYETN